MGIFTEKVALITGGASGIGRALATELGKRGARLILADVDTALLEETVETIKNAGVSAKGLQLDVTDFEAVSNAIHNVMAEFGRLDYLFNNAGIAVCGEAQSFSIDDWRSVIDTNLYGVVNGVAAAYPLMIKQGGGHIVNTASLAGLVPVPGEISYTASKYGVVGLSHVLRQEGAAHGVKVSVVCPGFIKTPIFYNAKVLGIERKKLLERMPKAISPDDCAKAVLRGIERNQATIVVTPVAKVLWLLQRFFPSLVMWLGRRFTKEMREMLRSSAAELQNQAQVQK
jgi:NAD(P)-dependent dehydrogenase (short-subunit alcohol dehydrogenase family)